jgi:hypothetical protein
VSKDLEEVIGLLEAWRKVFRHLLAIGEINGRDEEYVVEQFAGALDEQLDSDAMAGALASAIYLLARDE